MEIWPRLEKEKSPSPINSNQRSKDCGESPEEEDEGKKKKKKMICQNCACRGGCNNMPFLSAVRQNGNTPEYQAHMGSIIIPRNSTKSKVGNKENIPLIWGLPQAGCEGNLGGTHFNWVQIWPPYWSGAQTGVFGGVVSMKKRDYFGCAWINVWFFRGGFCKPDQTASEL